MRARPNELNTARRVIIFASRDTYIYALHIHVHYIVSAEQKDALFMVLRRVRQYPRSPRIQIADKTYLYI